MCVYYMPVHVHICLFVSYWFSEVDGIDTVLNRDQSSGCREKDYLILVASGWMVDSVSMKTVELG